MIAKADSNDNGNGNGNGKKRGKNGNGKAVTKKTGYRPNSTSFAPGNQAAVGHSSGKGNPFGLHVQRFRSIVFNTLTEADVKKALAALVKLAASGDLGAIRELLDRTAGKAGAAEDAPQIKIVIVADDEWNRRSFASDLGSNVITADATRPSG